LLRPLSTPEKTGLHQSSVLVAHARIKSRRSRGKVLLILLDIFASGSLVVSKKESEHDLAGRSKKRKETLKKLNISIEKTIISIKKLIISIEKLIIFIEKDNIFIEKGNISIEKLIISIEKGNVFIEKTDFFTIKISKAN